MLQLSFCLSYMFLFYFTTKIKVFTTLDLNSANTRTHPHTHTHTIPHYAGVGSRAENRLLMIISCGSRVGAASALDGPLVT